MLIEIFGYIGSTLVVVSMLMASIVKLRIVNTVGSIISGTYALIIGSFPLALMNFCLIVINIYNLFKLLKSKQNYDLVEGNTRDASVQYFLEHYKEDIRSYFPAFDMTENGFDKAYLVFCEGTPAGILLGTGKEEGVMDIALDYAAPTYRDCSVGAYLYAQLAEKGMHKLLFSQKESEAHVSYLNKMGFVKENDVYVKIL